MGYSNESARDDVRRSTQTGDPRWALIVPSNLHSSRYSLRNRKSGIGNPSPKAERARILSQWARQGRDDKGAHQSAGPETRTIPQGEDRRGWAYQRPSFDG